MANYYASVNRKVDQTQSQVGSDLKSFIRLLLILDFKKINCNQPSQESLKFQNDFRLIVAISTESTKKISNLQSFEICCSRKSFSSLCSLAEGDRKEVPLSQWQERAERPGLHQELPCPWSQSHQMPLLKHTQ